MDVSYEKIGKYVIAECQTTKECGVGKTNAEALEELKIQLADYAVDIKQPYFKERRALSHEIFSLLFQQNTPDINEKLSKLSADFAKYSVS